MMRKIEVDKEICFGCELYVTQYPDLFELIEEHSQVRKDADFSKTDWKKLLAIVQR